VLCRGIQENLLDDGRLLAPEFAQRKKSIVADVREFGTGRAGAGVLRKLRRVWCGG
jgi:hypothetical protein